MIGQQLIPDRKSWTKLEYNELTEQGVFSGHRFYLFRGKLVETPPPGHLEAVAITQLGAALHEAFGIGMGCNIRIRLPFDAPGDSMPEPDALVCTDKQGMREPHPNEALLVVEVAETSLEEEQEKALEYAAAGVPEYWIIDVQNCRVEVYRDPIVDKSAELGLSYSFHRLLNPFDSIELLTRRGVSISLAQLFE